MADLYSGVVYGVESASYTFGNNTKTVTENAYNMGTPALTKILISPKLSNTAVDLGSDANRAITLAALNNAGVEVYGFGEVDSSSPHDLIVFANNNTLTTVAKIETALILSHTDSVIDSTTTVVLYPNFTGDVIA
jgi:hypothetical protein